LVITETSSVEENVNVDKAINIFNYRSMDVYLSASEAAAFLEVSKPTLYAYVSRGLVRSESRKNTKSRRYYRLDLETLKGRKQIRRQPQTEVAGALNWGVPLMDSALTLILDGRLYYRGIDVNELVATKSFWQVAQWFWSGKWDYEAPIVVSKVNSKVKDPLTAIHALLIEQAANDPLGYDFTFPAVAETGANILRQILSILSGRSDADIVEAGQFLSLAWSPRQLQAKELLNAALILCIDHELNASSFTARVAASAGCSLYEVISASLCALHGTRHGGDIFRAYSFLAELVQARSVKEMIMQSVRTGADIPGFGHRLYPSGDPRAEILFRLTRELFPAEMRPLDRAIFTATSLLKRKPTIDLALAVVSIIIGQPSASGFYLFALGRTVGWIAHAAEQRVSHQLIRPRARYTGIMPEFGSGSLSTNPTALVRAE
jgi:citrate synthase